MMRVLVFMLLVIPGLLPAQIVEVKEERPPKFVVPSGVGLGDLIHTDETGYWVRASKRTGAYTLVKGFIKYGPNLKRQFENFFEEESLNIYGIEWLKDRLLVRAKDAKMETVNLTCDKNDGHILKQRTEKDWDDDDRIKTSYNKNYVWEVSYSADSTSVIYLNGFYRWDIDKRLVVNYERLVLPAQYDSTYMVLWSRLVGSIYYLAIGSVQGGIVGDCAMVRYDVLTKKVMTYNLALKDKHIASFKFVETDSVLKCVGFFKEKYRERLQGICYIACKVADGSLLNARMNYFTEAMLAGKVYVKDIEPANDGAVTLDGGYTMQEIASCGSNELMAASELNGFGYKGPDAVGASKEVPYMDNLLFKLNERGVLKWISVLPKSLLYTGAAYIDANGERRTNYSGSVAAISGDKCYVFYNDKIANLQKTVVDRPLAYDARGRLDKTTAIMVGIIDSKGNIERKVLRDYKQNKDAIIPALSGVTKPGVVSLCTQPYVQAGEVYLKVKLAK